MSRLLSPVWNSVLFFLMLASVAAAQNYQSLDKNRIVYYNNVYGNIKCIRIDSVNMEKDTTLFPFKNIRKISDNCFTPFGPSWIGEKVIVKDNLNLFFNRDRDTIKINVLAGLGESWLVFEMPDSLKILATVTECDTMSFLGLVDSVKTIEFQAYNRAMRPADLAVNGMTMKISKHYGGIRMLNFFSFPNEREYDWLDDPLQEYDLAGLSNPRAGIQNLTWFEVFDFQPGDELHVLYNSYCWSPEYGEYSSICKTITKYLARTDYSDSILYVTLTESSEDNDWNGEKSFRYRFDTSRSVIKSNMNFDKLPGEPVIDSYQSYANSMVYSDPLIKSEPPYAEWISGGYDSCWTMPISDGCIFSNNYYKGFGGPYYMCYSYFTCTGETHNDLVYYNKGDITWGTPLVISGMAKAKIIKPETDIYPNPAREFITVKTSSSGSAFLLEILDLQGKTLLQRNINTDISQIKLDKNLKGIYIYRITNNNRTIRYGKLIVE